MSEAKQNSQSETIGALLQMTNMIASKLDELNATMSKHILEENAAMTTKLDIFTKSAFADGDVDLHRRDHESRIKKAEASALFWRKLLDELSRWGLMGFLGWAAYSLWHAFLVGPAIKG